MKILIILCLTILLQANCTEENEALSNRLFYEASQESNALKQITLLERAMKACFSYELEVSLLGLEIEQSSSKEEKLKLYDALLESLSQIKNNDALVKAQQNKIHQAMALLYEQKSPELSLIYEQKVEAQNRVEEKKESHYGFWILFLVALLLWAFWDLVKKWGKS
ncbi:MAG TPA: hypothetical protein ENK82_04130 [Campylobacterales bacterium]|nr:hypothetical protein [Campylobacterales bacterium]